MVAHAVLVDVLDLRSHCRSQRWVKAQPRSSVTSRVNLECGIAMRLPIVHVAGRAKQYVTGKTGSRLHSAATDSMSEGRRQVDVDFVITGVVLIAIFRPQRDEARPRKSANQRVNRDCLLIPPEPRPYVGVKAGIVMMRRGRCASGWDKY